MSLILKRLNIEDFRAYCLRQKGATEELPFGEDTLCFKVGGKIFALTNMESKPLRFNVKCDPEKAAMLRETYSCVLPGYHMNKKHWNTIIADGSVNRRLLEEWINDSYQLVVASLSKVQRQSLHTDSED